NSRVSHETPQDPRPQATAPATRRRHSQSEERDRAAEEEVIDSSDGERGALALRGTESRDPRQDLARDSVPRGANAPRSPSCASVALIIRVSLLPEAPPSNSSATSLRKTLAASSHWRRGCGRGRWT